MNNGNIFKLRILSMSCSSQEVVWQNSGWKEVQSAVFSKPGNNSEKQLQTQQNIINHPQGMVRRYSNIAALPSRAHWL